MKSIPLVVHLIYKLDFGGLETLLVDSVNRMPAEKYRHAIVCLTDYTEFSKKITRSDVAIFALNKRPGLGLETHLNIWKLLRKLRPSILHTYNLPTIEYTVAARLAGVPICVHAEHGRDATDPEGKNWKHNFLRRSLIPLVDYFIPVSSDLKRWLSQTIRVPAAKNRLIQNGVDTQKFTPADTKSAGLRVRHFPENCFVIGTVGRIQDVKNHCGLIDAFIQLRALMPEQKEAFRLVIIGDGALLPVLRTKVVDAGIADYVWLPGARDDIAQLMQTFSVFAMTSIAEGTPVVLLEAMATGLAVVSTKVGGIPELVIDGETGKLVDAYQLHSFDAQAFALAISAYVLAPELRLEHGQAGRKRVENRYSIDAMLASYMGMYDALLTEKIRN
ncbi:TIGR03088 family PEP-CTERM/XrtA system glycosyltransferase [Undibacterium sp. Ren11W]|uniref:TIGR03088 family PEP-CTERM/XrtA system glycosyltransferase n=1 Tax=Undibacterium sp. Ren11W TaxID=3413045 RepID=UPI003BF37273